MLPSVNVPRVADPTTQRGLDSLAGALKAVLACPLLDGVFVTTTVTGTPKNVPHLLGRKPVGCLLLVGQQVEVLTEDVTQRTDVFLRLSCTAYDTGSMSVTLWVF